jgi:hypothetical protein
VPGTRDGGAFAFVGAGASAGLYPLWGELLEKLADEALSRSMFAYSRSISACSRPMPPFQAL